IRPNPLMATRIATMFLLATSVAAHVPLMENPDYTPVATRAEWGRFGAPAYCCLDERSELGESHIVGSRERCAGRNGVIMPVRSDAQRPDPTRQPRARKDVIAKQYFVCPLSAFRRNHPQISQISRIFGKAARIDCCLVNLAQYGDVFVISLSI